MMVMLSNHSSPLVHFWCGRYPARVGWLIGPKGWPKTKKYPWMQYALDNDCFNGWNEKAWWDMLTAAKMESKQPLWVAIPDVVGDAAATQERWRKFAPLVRQFYKSETKHPWPLCFVAQDGMLPGDVPKDADYVFMGGTDRWKWRSIEPFALAFPGRLHVGRVNVIRRLTACYRLHVASVDGTGWFRDGYPSRRLAHLERWVSNPNPNPDLISFHWKDKPATGGDLVVANVPDKLRPPRSLASSGG